MYLCDGRCSGGSGLTATLPGEVRSTLTKTHVLVKVNGGDSVNGEEGGTLRKAAERVEALFKFGLTEGTGLIAKGVSGVGKCKIGNYDGVEGMGVRYTCILNFVR